MAERNLDFDAVIDRYNTRSIKYDFAEERGYPKDVLPLWVADMDFKTSSYVEDALVERSREAIFGYSETKGEYFDAVNSWMLKHHSWKIDNDWLVKTPGVVCAIAMAIRAYTDQKDAVLIQLPVYYPFKEVIEDNDRIVVSNDLYLGEDNRYHIDFDDFEQKITNHKIKLFILCNPHNPVGRVWNREELLKIGEICLKHGVIVVSDEIHSDFVFEGKHTVFASLSDEIRDITITCTSPSKTFNLASMLISNIFIADEKLRKRFSKELSSTGISQLSVLGIVACETAYKKGEIWYEKMISYIRDNIEYTKKFVEEYLHGVKMIEPEGTYLIWLDFRALGYNVDQLDDLIINGAKLWLDSGKIFGSKGEGFQRINVACPRRILQDALERIRRACYGLEILEQK